jgi:hypothetical protein
MDLTISDEHLAAVNRRRRIIVNFDVMIVDPAPDEDPHALAKERLTFADDPRIRIDSIWWNWGEGNVVPYPSKLLPPYDHPGFRRWSEEGIDIVRIFLDETHRRGMEAFFSHRMNGSDNDPRYVPGVGVVMDMVAQSGGPIGDAPKVYRIPLKEEHPDWVFLTPWSVNGYWDHAVEGVRRYVFAKLREVAESYDFDGIELDFARGVAFPEGQGWVNRDRMTQLIRQLRLMLLETEARRGRPFLLAARVPEDLPGCHFDGLDVETWAREGLVDILVMGCRSFDVDIPAFRRMAAGTPIKLYPALDDHHSTDGYCTPPIEVFRGVFSNWDRQGADGLQTFNFAYAPLTGQPWWRTHRQVYRELSYPDTTRPLDRTFVLQRRGGGHGATVIPDPEDWSTPRHWYANSNMLSQLPALLANDGKADTLLTLFVGADLSAESDGTEEISLWVLLHDFAQGDYVHVRRSAGPPPVQEGRVQRAVVRDWGIPVRPGKEDPMFLYNSPPLKSVARQLELRLNNALLDRPRLRRGWLVFKARPDLFAVGSNLLGLRVTGRQADSLGQLSIEKLELRVRYGRG